MNILVTGANGQLGSELRLAAAKGRDRYVFTDVTSVPGVETVYLDITNIDAVRIICDSEDIDVIVNCAAYTNVDKAEDDSATALLLNSTAVGTLATVAAERDAVLIHISTDYVFHGDKPTAYLETDEPDPQTVYGASKLAGERSIREFCSNHLILRLAWLYGDGGPSFLHTMLKLADGTRPTLKVVNDQRGNPTSAVAVARHLRMLLERTDLHGIMHLTCEGETTWYDYAKEIFHVAGVKQEVVPCTTAEFPRPAHRPANSALEKAALARSGLPPMPHWKEALREFMAEM